MPRSSASACCRRSLPVTDDEVVDYLGHFYDFVARRRAPTPSPRSTRRRPCAGSSTPPGPYAEMQKAANLPPSFVIIQRINLGLYAIFGELHATGNWRRIAEELWPFVDGPPVHPDGRADRAVAEGRDGAHASAKDWSSRESMMDRRAGTDLARTQLTAGRRQSRHPAAETHRGSAAPVLGCRGERPFHRPAPDQRARSLGRPGRGGGLARLHPDVVLRRTTARHRRVAPRATS